MPKELTHWLLAERALAGLPAGSVIAGTIRDHHNLYLAGAVVLILTVALPLISLVGLTSSLTLFVFALVDISLWRVQRRHPSRRGFAVPHWIPPLAAIVSLAMVGGHLEG